MSRIKSPLKLTLSAGPGHAGIPTPIDELHLASDAARLIGITTMDFAYLVLLGLGPRMVEFGGMTFCKQSELRRFIQSTTTSAHMAMPEMAE